MDDAPLMGVGQPVGDLDPVAQDRLRREAVGGDQLAQRLPLDQLHHDVRLAVLLADLMHRGNVRVTQSRGAAGLVEELAARVVVGVRQHLDGDGPLELGVEGAVHRSHPTLTEARFNPIRAELAAGFDRHGTRRL